MALRRAPPGAFEVIASHPSNPWISGASSLFSAEYFALARSRLARGGRMLAWVQLYETDRRGPCAVSWRPTCGPSLKPGRCARTPRRASCCCCFAGDAPSDADALVARVGRRMDDASRRALADAGVLTLDDLRARVVAGPGELARFARGVEAHREDRPVAECRIADRMLAGPGSGQAEALAGL